MPEMMIAWHMEECASYYSEKTMKFLILRVSSHTGYEEQLTSPYSCEAH